MVGHASEGRRREYRRAGESEKTGTPREEREVREAAEPREPQDSLDPHEARLPRETVEPQETPTPKESIERRMDSVRHKLEAQETREDRVSEGMDKVQARLERSERQAEGIEERLRELSDALEDTEAGEQVEVPEGGGMPEVRSGQEVGEPEEVSRPRGEVQEVENRHEETTTQSELSEYTDDAIYPVEETPSHMSPRSEFEEHHSPQDIEIEENIEERLDDAHEMRTVKEIIHPLRDMNEVTVEEVFTAIKELSVSALEEGRRIQRIDLRSELSSEEVQSLEEYVRGNAMEIEGKLSESAQSEIGEHEHIRVGMVEGKLYVRRLDENPIRLENAYADLYYYFREKEDFERYLNDAGNAIGLDGASQSEIQAHLREMAEQLVTEPTNELCINPKTNRIRGDFVYLVNDISGKTLRDLEGHISKLTGLNGHGGIENPRFPQGEKLEVTVARLAATVLSDCTITPNGVIKYGEPDVKRIERVVKTIQEFGDINPSSAYIKDGGHYITHLPFIIGKLMMHRGIPSGDRTIQNPRLISSVREGSEKVQNAYLEDFMTQDVCVGKNTVIWRRANVVDAGEKAESYDFESKIDSKEIDFIITYGRKSTGNSESSSLSLGKLAKLELNHDKSISDTSKKIKQILYENPNNLITDEVKIVRDRGIDVELNPSEIKYYPKSGRVSAIWQAHTTGMKEAIKLGMISRPNDILKERKVKEMILNNSTIASKAIEELENHEIDFEKWW